MAEFYLFLENKQKIKLDDKNEIHRGGEGRILTVAARKDKVAKIYHQGIPPISTDQHRYLSTLDRDLFVIPQELLFDASGQIKGFLMEYLGAHFFPISAIFNKNFCTRNSIDHTTKQRIGESLIKAMQYAHSQKVIIGDFNQYNILVTTLGETKLIDTDSYQTPSHQHSGMLLDDIRDYLYGGFVSQKSDFFALSVILFYQFTHTHPFKGIHKKYKSLSDRMIHKIPIFSADPDLKTPKCYEAIAKTNLQTQFTRLYVAGERFLMNLQGISGRISTKIKTIPVTKLDQKDLSVHVLLESNNILDIFFSAQKGLIETTTHWFVFDTANKGYAPKKHEIKKADWDKLIIGSENMLAIRQNRLFHYISETEIVELTNFTIPDNAILHQAENILIVIGNDVMTWLYVDEIYNQSIRNKRTEVFQAGFRYLTGLVQNAGGIYRIFYNTGKDIATVKLNESVKEIKQNQQVGIIQNIENDHVKNRYFKIKGLQLEISPTELEYSYDFAFMPTDGGEGFIFEPNDNRINIVRTQDFKTISTMEALFVTEQSKLQYCQSGIIAWEGDSVYLLNKK